MNISKKKHLEMILERVPKHHNPKVELEQYSTPANIAADLLWNAYSIGDIGSKRVIDLGCGSGIFTFGSLLLGAKTSLGVDIDKESIDLAKKTLTDIDVPNAEFISSDVTSFNSISDLLNNLDGENDVFNESLFVGYKADTLIQNPPFGSQERGTRNIDRKFIEFAVNSADVIYSFHMASTEEFVINYFKDLGAEVTHKLMYTFSIPKIYDFHTDESRDVKVVVLRAKTF